VVSFATNDPTIMVPAGNPAFAGVAPTPHSPPWRHSESSALRNENAYRPGQTGARFSMNAARPSAASSVNASVPICASINTAD
jgi:hypothetical protein